MANENREYKDSVFCDLFYDDSDAKKHLLELYNALCDTQYTDPDIIELVRLEEVFFKSMKNDVAFMVKNQRIVLNEHQSTINPNMPLRSLMYIGREYERIVSVRKRYQKTLVQIPTPLFYTFYNGEDDYPSEQELHLSDAFIDKTNPALELTVKVINIKPDKGHKILKKCPVLREYSEFVEIVKKYQKDKDSLKEAIYECIQRGILEKYLKRKGSEVVNMLMAEYDYEMDMEVQREEAHQEGFQKGIQKGIQKERQENLRKYINRIVKKLKKGQTAEKIADDLEEPLKDIEYLVTTAERYAPDYNEESILNEILKRNGQEQE